MRPIALAFALLLPLPLAAQGTGVFGDQTADLGSTDASAALSAAYVACGLGQGDADATAAIFTAAGWLRTDDSEMGLIELGRVGGDVYVTLYDEGRICSVTAETIGTSDASERLTDLATANGQVFNKTTDSDGCLTVTFAGGLSATVTSTGQDPICQDETASDTRFLFGEP